MSDAERTLRAIRSLMRDMSFECMHERHTCGAEALTLVDEDGKPSTTGTGYFAHADGRRFTDGDLPAGWPDAHRAEPCGHCWGCRMVALAGGVLDVMDGRGSVEMWFRDGAYRVKRIRRRRAP